MTEDDFEASSLEQPDSESPAEHHENNHDGADDSQGRATQGQDAQSDEDVSQLDHTEEGSTLEKPAEEVFYVKKGSITRRPKYGVFGVLGGLLGLLVGLVLAQVGAIPLEQDYSRVDLSIVLVGLGVPAGILLALLCALILDRRSRK